MLLPRYRQDQPTPPRRIEDKLREITNRDDNTTTIVEAGPLTDDPTHKRLRGIPCIAQSVSGTQPGTDPLQAALSNDRRRRYTHPNL